MVVPAVVIGTSLGMSRDRGRCGVVTQLEGGRSRVAGVVATRTGEGDPRAVRPGVGRSAGATFNPRGRVGAVPADGDRVVVPAVRIRAARRAAADGRGRRIELNRKSGGGGIPRLVGTA